MIDDHLANYSMLGLNKRLTAI